jgi:hypothetical protein
MRITLPFSRGRGGFGTKLSTDLLRNTLTERQTQSWENLSKLIREPLEGLKVLLYTPNHSRTVEYKDFSLVDFDRDRKNIPDGLVIGIAYRNNSNGNLHITNPSLVSNIADEKVVLVQNAQGKALVSARVNSTENFSVIIGTDHFAFDVVSRSKRAA